MKVIKICFTVPFVFFFDFLDLNGCAKYTGKFC